MKPFSSHSALSGVNPARGASAPVKMGDATDTISFDDTGDDTQTLAGINPNLVFDTGFDLKYQASTQRVMIQEAPVTVVSDGAFAVVNFIGSSIDVVESQGIMLHIPDIMDEWGIVADPGALMGIQLTVPYAGGPTSGLLYLTEHFNESDPQIITAMGAAVGTAIMRNLYDDLVMSGPTANQVASETIPAESLSMLDTGGSKQMLLFDPQNNFDFSSIGNVNQAATFLFYIRTDGSKTELILLGNTTNNCGFQLSVQGGSELKVVNQSNVVFSLPMGDMLSVDNHLLILTYDRANNELRLYWNDQSVIVTGIDTDIHPMLLDRFMYKADFGFAPPAAGVKAIYIKNDVIDTTTVARLQQWFRDNYDYAH